MNNMQQSSKAQDRALGTWFLEIQHGRIKLPRFQRFEAWDRGRICSFLNTIIKNLPVGVTLVLEVSGTEKFESRYIVSSTPTTPAPVLQHLLDGQQRLTAFWRSMHNNYKRETFFVYFPQFDQTPSRSDAEVEIRCIPRWFNKHHQRMPRWADEPEKCLERGLIPVSLLRPYDSSSSVEQWIDKATKSSKPLPTDNDAFSKLEKFNEKNGKLKSAISELRERVTHFNLPYLSLPSDTSKDVALQVFINMNTNSKPLSLYDIIVAEVENVAEKSLHALAADLIENCPKAVRYGNVSDLILSTSALLQEKIPSTRGMIEMDKSTMISNWGKLERGIDKMVYFLESQHIFDNARLPTNAVLAVIAASYEIIPDTGDFLAKAEKLLRMYMWSSFFTDRYENSAASRAFSDFKAIKTLLQNEKFTSTDLEAVPVLNRSEFPLADADSLMAAGWPKSAGIAARAILAVTIYLGAIDFADHQAASYENIQKREYHHIFPDDLLSQAGIPSYLALNCALITWKTNRIIGCKEPLKYLEDRVEWTNEDTVRERLKSHLISYNILAKAHYENLAEPATKNKLKNDFYEFLLDRASLVVAALTVLTEGDTPTLESLWSCHLSKDSEIIVK